MPRTAAPGQRSAAGRGCPRGNNPAVAAPQHDDDFVPLLNDLFGQFFGGLPDLAVTIEISDAEAAAGVTRTVPISRTRICDRCDGRGSTDASAVTPCTACGGRGGTSSKQGFFLIQHVCQTCNGAGRVVRDPCTGCRGTGRLTEQDTVTIDIPAGAQHEQTIRIAGAGNRKPDGTAGDVLAYLLVGGRPDSRYAAFAGPPPEAEIPQARIHNAKRPVPVAMVLTLASVIAILVALAVASR